MSRLVARTEEVISAELERVRELLLDYRYGRSRILPPEYFSDYRVEQNEPGEGALISYRLQAGGRQRSYRIHVEEPATGRAIVERDTRSSFVMTWTLTPSEGGDRTLVVLESSWEGAIGIGGFFERIFAPRALRRIQGDVLERLRMAVEEGVT
ncbi:MAG: SRPBCC family protein [Rubrobacter sp.]|nr:SRPBCC family protein [Rubrobacter sp.]